MECGVAFGEGGCAGVEGVGGEGSVGQEVGGREGREDWAGGWMVVWDWMGWEDGASFCQWAGFEAGERNHGKSTLAVQFA